MATQSFTSFAPSGTVTWTTCFASNVAVRPGRRASAGGAAAAAPPSPAPFVSPAVSPDAAHAARASASPVRSVGFLILGLRSELVGDERDDAVRLAVVEAHVLGRPVQELEPDLHRVEVQA